MAPEIPAEWTNAELWAWERIAADEPADFNSRVPDAEPLEPGTEEGWGEDRRVPAKFLQTILTQRELVEAMPFGGVRILGALIDDEPVNLEHARLQRQLWLENSRILTDVKCRNLRVDGWFSLEKSFVTGSVDLGGADITENMSLSGATFEGAVSMAGLAVESSLFMYDGADFKKDVVLLSAKVGGQLDMTGSTFEGVVDMNRLEVENSLFMRDKANFKKDVVLLGAKVGSQLDMDGSTFEGAVNMDGLAVESSLFMRDGADFKKDVILHGVKVGGNLDLTASTFAGAVDLTGCTVTEVFVLAISESSSARWEDGASLTLRNTHVDTLQDWWRSEALNAWPKNYQLEGFSYDRLGWIGEDKEANMLSRPVTSYVQWLGGDPGSSPQPYERLAHLFHEAGDPYKSNAVLYAARERRRSTAWSTVKDYRHTERREWLRALGVSAGLWVLRATIGYGLGNRYFRVLWWVFGLTLLGTVILIDPGGHTLSDLPKLFFASLDQLLPIVTLDQAHDALIFGDRSAKLKPQPYGVLVYFYVHKILGWVLGSFLVAGLAGLTQRN